MLRTVRRTPLNHCKNKTVTKKGGAGSLNLGLKGFKPVFVGIALPSIKSQEQSWVSRNHGTKSHTPQRACLAPLVLGASTGSVMVYKRGSRIESRNAVASHQELAFSHSSAQDTLIHNLFNMNNIRKIIKSGSLGDCECTAA